MKRQTANAPMASGTAPMPRAAMLLMAAAMLTSACATTAGSVTEQAICRELRIVLPTWSRKDTEQSRIDGARFLDVFEAVCPPRGRADGKPGV